MYNNTYERPRTQIEKCEHLARMKFENPIEKAQRERDERVYRFSSIDEAIGVLSVVRRAWEKSDFIQMSDFNDLTHKLDAALKANADAAAGKAEAETVTAIAQTIANSKICRAKFGTYTGTGLSGQNHPNSVECGFCPAVLVLFRADGGQKTTVIRGVTACSSGIGSMNNYYTWGDSGVSRVSQTLDSDSGGYMASSQFNSSGKEYCYLVLGYDADWIKQKTAPSLSARG